MFCIQIAEVLIAIKNRYAFTERLCADYIVDTSLGGDVTVVNGDKPILRWRTGEVAEPPDGTPSGEGACACTSSAVPP